MEILAMILFVLFGGITLITLLAALGLILPGATTRTKAVLDASLGRAFIIGLVNLAFFLILFLLLVSAGEWSGQGALSEILGVLGILIVLTLTVFALAGLAGLARLLGERIGEAKSAFRGDLRGGLVLVLAGLAPFVGWYLFTPFILATALGASILALFRKKSKAQAEEG
jgi:hypothetical protein